MRSRNGYWYSFDDQMHDMFGGKVYRLALSAGRTCPNRDGTKGTGGCIFCSAGGSGDFAEPAELSVAEQIAKAKARVDRKIGDPKRFAGYMAYFQSFTNTYGNQQELIGYFRAAAAHPEIVSIAIGTRPDCLETEMLEALSAINREKPVFVELGLQTIHEQTAAYINRCYPLSVFEDAFCRLKAAGLKVVVHVIIGLPGEDRAKTMETVQWLSRLRADDGTPIDGIKLQLMHVLAGTRLGELLPEDVSESVAETIGREPGTAIRLKDGMLLPQYTLEEYAELLTELCAELPEETAVHRLTGDAPKRLLILPRWTGDKKRVLNTIRAAFRRKYENCGEDRR